jgi:hypothetical protein
MAEPTLEDLVELAERFPPGMLDQLEALIDRVLALPNCPAECSSDEK